MMLINFILLTYFSGALAGLLRREKLSYLLAFTASFLILPVSVKGIYGIHGEVMPFLPTGITIDAFSSLFLLVLAVVGSTLSAYLLSYSFKGSRGLASMAFNGALFSALLFLLTDNLERLTLAYELFAFFTFIIVLTSGIKKAERSAWKYLWNTQLFGMVPMTIVAGLAYSAVGDMQHLTFEGLSESIDKLPTATWLPILLYLSASLVRSGVFPFHTWVPDTYRRIPSAFVPLFLIGETLGFYLLTRVAFFMLPFPKTLGYVIAFLGTISAFSTLYSFREIRLKRKFAFHSIMDMGVSYFALGVALVTKGQPVGTLALLGALLHTLYQTIYKSTLFLGIGSIEHYGEEPNICSLRKLLRGHVMAFIIILSALSMAAIPPLASFTSRLLIYSSIFGTRDIYLWTMGLTIGFLGLFPLASIIQLRRINRMICKREVERNEIPFLIRTATGFLAFAGFVLAVFPFMLLPLLKDAVEEVYPVFHLFLSSGVSLGAAVLLTAILTGWKIGNIPTDRVSELLLIFYNIGDILRDSESYLRWRAKELYLHTVLPVIKVIPKHEIPLIKDCEDALDYPTRHLDEALFSPIIRGIRWAAQRSTSRNPDMNVLMSGFAIAFALLIVILGVMLWT
ncbi:proton-conducting transporter transmembrane domain-containing protein [Thermococcus sp.]